MSKTEQPAKLAADGGRLGEVIRQGRQALGLSLRQLAPRVNVHHSFLARLEAGDYQSAKPDVLQRLSKVLELDQRDLFALAGLDAPEGLPSFTPYLRAKYGMPDDLIRQLGSHFDYLAHQHGIAAVDRTSGAGGAEPNGDTDRATDAKAA